MKARSLAIAGMLAALQILTLLVAYIIPTIKLALLFAASVYPAVLLRAGISKKAIAVSSLVSVILTIFLIQIPEIQGGFIAFFGWYGLVHESTHKMEKVRKQIIRWACYILSAALMYVAVQFVFPIELKYSLWIFSSAGIAAFIVMQILFELVIKEFVAKTKIKAIDGKITFKS